MPELPEVEVIKRQLAKDIVGKKIGKIEILSAKQFIGKPGDIIGAQIINVWRRAKLLGFDLNNKLTVLTHLKLTGQLIFFSKTLRSMPGRTTRVIIKFGDGSRLFFNDLRKFGWMKIVKSLKSKVKSLGYGPEPLGKEFTVEYLKGIFTKTHRAIKIVLMDQEKIAGIGNIYANEALFEAKIDPRRFANSLDNSEVERLREAITKVLREGIKYGGTTAADDAYVRPDSTLGRYQQKLKVYQHEGQLCSRCGAKIIRIKLGGRGTFFCPVCQK